MIKLEYENDEAMIEALGRIAIFLNDKGAAGYQHIINQAQKRLKQLTHTNIRCVPLAKPTENTCNEAVLDHCIDAFRKGNSINIDGVWVTDYGVAIGAIARAVQAYLDNAKIVVGDAND